MTMHRNISKKSLLVLIAGTALLVSVGAWALQPGSQGAPSTPPPGGIVGPAVHKGPIAVQPVPIESVPAVPYDQGSSEITVPFVQEGTLFLAKVKRLIPGATSTVEVSRQEGARNVSSAVKANSLTGEYFYQTYVPGSHDLSSVSTWIGDVNGKSTLFAKGILSATFSPGGSYIAMMDGSGNLSLVDRQKNRLADYGPAGYPVFSPDGTTLVFYRMVMWGYVDLGGITVVDLVSGKTIATYDPTGREYTPITFSDDGRTLFFTQETPDFQKTDLYAMSIPSGEVRLVTTGSSKLPYSSYRSVQFIPESRTLALAADGNIWLVDTETGSIQIINNVADVVQVDESGMLIARSTRSNATGVWNVVPGQ